MWQVSGENTSSIKKRISDMRDEFGRTFTSLAEIWLGERTESVIMSTLRRLKIGDYYAWPRLFGPTSLGPHDIEVLAPSKALLDLFLTCDIKTATSYMSILKDIAPSYSELIKDYVEVYNEFIDASDNAKKEIYENQEVREYLLKLADEKTMRKLMSETDGNGKIIVDSYQFTRTTAFWAAVCEKDAIKDASFSAYWDERVIEQRALDAAINYYLESDKNKVGFFLDQVRNPKLLDLLEKRKNKGDKIASQLIRISDSLDELSEKVLVIDRQISSTLVEDGLEYNPLFNILTGVAYTKWLYAEVLRYRLFHKTGTQPGKINFSNADELAFAASLANALRETGPSYQLAANRYLLSSTPPFIDKYEILGTMDRFINEVYLPSYPEGKHPEEDYRSFNRRCLNLMVEQMSGYYLPGSTFFEMNTEDMSSNAMVQFQNFAEKAIDFGYRRIIFTPPHDSWIRGFLNNQPYIFNFYKSLAPKE